MRRSSPLIAVVFGIVALSACGSDGVSSDAERFCGEAISQRDTIVSPPLGTDAEVAATLDFYRLMGQLAPLAISDQWNDLVEILETASTVVPGDPNSEQTVALQAYATERSAFEVKNWLLDNCGLDIGPITTIAPQGSTPLPIVTTADGSIVGGSVPPGTPAGGSLPADTAPAGSVPPGPTTPTTVAPPATPAPATTAPTTSAPPG